jgi:hypothetical protein
MATLLRFHGIALRNRCCTVYTDLLRGAGLAGTNIEAWRWDQGVGTAWLEIAAAAFWEHQAPALVWGAPGTLIAYEGDASGDPTVKRHIYGRLWYPHAVFLPAILRSH